MADGTRDIGPPRPAASRRLARGVAWSTAVASAASWAWFTYRLSFEPFLLCLALLFVVVILAFGSLGRLIAGPRENRLWESIVFAALVASPFLGDEAGKVIRDADFRFRRLPRYTALVERMERGEISVPEQGMVSLPRPFGDENIAWGVFASRDAAGQLQVTFTWGLGFPATKCLCYFFRASGTWGPEESHGSRRLGDHWFEALE